MSKISVADFIAKAEQIAAEGPGYELGHWGQDHLCDCIGLVIGAIRRAGGNWRGSHGTNYAARNEMTDLQPYAGMAGEIEIGEVVYKVRNTRDGKYALPDKYRRGGKNYNGDVFDYYHIGIVESVNPLRIRHMTPPKPRIDTQAGRWSYHGHLKKIDYQAKQETKREEKKAMGQATVTLPNGSKGSTVNLREKVEGDILARVPVGTVVDVLEDLGTWCHISVQGAEGYMMSNFIEYPGGGEEISGDILTAEEREKIDGALIEIEMRIETIRTVLGRG